VLVLLTDGENNRGAIDPRTAAQAAAAVGVKIYAIGVGTEGMAPVPVGRGLFGLRYENRPVRIDEVLLTDVARTTGGRYFRARDPAALQAIYEQIDQLERTPVRTKTYVRFTEQYRWPLGVAVLALASSWGCSRGGGRCHDLAALRAGAVAAAGRGRAPRAARDARARCGGGGASRGSPGSLRRSSSSGIAPAATATRPGWRPRGSAPPPSSPASPSPGHGGGRSRRWSGRRASDVVLALDRVAVDDGPPTSDRTASRGSSRRSGGCAALAPGDRTAIVAFAGAELHSHPVDHDDGALELPSTASIRASSGRRGARWRARSRQSTELLLASKGGGDRAVVVMSDGEAFEPVEDVQEAGARGARGGGRAGDRRIRGPRPARRSPVREGNTVTRSATRTARSS
jgi:hypothetical protein